MKLQQVVFCGVTATKREEPTLNKFTRDIILAVPLDGKWALFQAEVLARPVTAKEESVTMEVVTVKE